MMLRRIAILAVMTAVCAWPLSAVAAPAVAEGEVLVMVDGGDADAVSLLDRLGAPVYHRASGRVLAGVDQAGLKTLGEAAVVLDRTPWSEGTSYYWVMIRDGRDAAFTVTGDVELLFRDGGVALIKALQDDAEKLSMAGHELAVVTRSHKVLVAPTKSTALSGTRAFGGEIDDMVAAVDQLSYTNKLQALEDFVTRYSYTTQCDVAGDWIYDQFVSYGLTAERHYFNIGGDTRFNVIATLPGYVYPDEVVFICGHYDSTSENPYVSAPGADDNGTGTAATIEAAKVLSNYTFERTIMFGCWAGEEQGLYGSGAYVDEIAAAEMDVVACYNFDMIGYSGNDPAPPDLVIYTNGSSLPLANLLSDAILYYVPTEVEPVIDTSALTASDHASFWNHGYKAILGIEDEAWGSDFSPYYHSTSDLVIHCDLVYATACTMAGVAAVAETAGPFTPSGMRVFPTTGFYSEGPNGGPFTPQTFDYTLTNYEDYAIDYTVSEDTVWLDISTSGGILPALGTATVTLSINSAADTLADGDYFGDVEFVNTTTHDGDCTRTCQLTVGVPEMQMQWDMNTNPGWSTEGQWAFGVPTGGGGYEHGFPDPDSGVTGDNVYGINLNGDYSTDVGSFEYLTTGAIDCSTLIEVSVKFQRWLNSDYPSYVYQTIDVSSDGVNWEQIYQNPASTFIEENSWTEYEYDLSAVADNEPTVYLRWGHAVGSTGAYAFSGWNIDDVEIWGIDGSSSPTDTVQVALGCDPSSGQLPFTTQMAVSLTNLTTENRRAAARIDVVLGSGTPFDNWKTGWTDLSPSDTFNRLWNQNLPAFGLLVGDNVFTLTGEDVTPAPYNQPPFAPAGGTDTDTCTVTATAP